MKRIFFFDFDGVIADTFQMSYETHLEFAKEWSSEEDYKQYFRGNIYESAKEEDPHRVKHNLDDIANHPFTRSFVAKLAVAKAFDGMPEVLRELAGRGEIIIVTSSVSDAVKGFLEANACDDVVSDVMGADVHHSKVVKMRRVFETRGVEASECVFVTDTLGDLMEAQVCGVDGVAVAWGFHDIETLGEGEPVAIVNTLEELVATLLGL